MTSLTRRHLDLGPGARRWPRLSGPRKHEFQRPTREVAQGQGPEGLGGRECPAADSTCTPILRYFGQLTNLTILRGRGGFHPRAPGEFLPARPSSAASTRASSRCNCKNRAPAASKPCCAVATSAAVSAGLNSTRACP